MIQIRTCLISAIFLTVLLMNLSTGQAFRCWYCNSDTIPRCGDPFNGTVEHRWEECNPTNYGISKYVCRKVKYHARQNNEVTIDRRCVEAGDREKDPCSQAALTSYPRVEHCSTCDTDLCNSAPTLFKVSSLFGPIVVLLSKINFV